MAADLVTLAEAEQYLLSPPEDAALVQALIARTSDIVRRYTGRRFIKDTYVEELNGGHRDLILRNTPIDTAAGLLVEDTAGRTPVAVDPDTYVIYPGTGFLRQRAGRWGAGHRRWRVSYTAGHFDATEAVAGDLKQATLDIVAALYGRRGADPGLESETLGDYSYRRRTDLATLGVPASAMAVLDLWREPGF